MFMMLEYAVTTLSRTLDAIWSDRFACSSDTMTSLSGMLVSPEEKA